MSTAHEYMIKTLLKAFGISVDDLKPSTLIPQLLASQNIDPAQVQNIVANAQRILVDYERNQAQNEMRMIAIINHLGIVDPVLMAQISTDHNSNGDN